MPDLSIEALIPLIDLFYDLSFRPPAGISFLDGTEQTCCIGGLRNRCSVSTIPSYSSSEIITTFPAF